MNLAKLARGGQAKTAGCFINVLLAVTCFPILPEPQLRLHQAFSAYTLMYILLSLRSNTQSYSKCRSWAS